MTHHFTRLTVLMAEKLLQLELKLMADLSALNANFIALTDAVTQNTAAVNTVVAELAAASGANDQPTIDALAARAADLTKQLTDAVAALQAATAPAPAPAA